MTVLHMGLDVGSTTIKIVVIDQNNQTLFSLYQRHFSDVRQTMVDLLLKAYEKFKGEKSTLSIAGSGGISAAQWLDADFTQEVVAGAEAISQFLPQTDVAIELGGEDAKLTFFDASIDQRMNETCAGGTGAFIDQMANFMRTDPTGLNELAKKAVTIYPIAARCGVFAKTDILPLLNEGAPREDIAASIFQAVVDQTIGGLACGRAIRGRIAFLGGPLFFLSELRYRFIQTLKLSPDEILCPDNAQLFVALGAALLSKKQEPKSFSHWAQKAEELARAELPSEIAPLPPLFSDLDSLKKFRQRHDKTRLARADWPSEGHVFVGMDAGSTTTKLVALDVQGKLLYSHYAHNHGNPLKSVIAALTKLYEVMPQNLKVAKAGVTGYGEALIQAALGVDVGEVETMAHYKAASFFEPEVSFIVDIGGQDIKCLSIKNGLIDRLMLNEACSSGCGSFLETFAKTLGLDARGFAQAALTAERPVDLGSRCTVFMNSKVKQAQKEGAPVGDISAGLSYSVVRNALYKVIRITRSDELGEKIMVQGGTFFNDAVLRAFELSIKREVVRPDIAGLMGAFGAALLAQENFDENKQYSRLIDAKTLAGFSLSTKTSRCAKCQNRCLLTINRFSDGRLFISGNRCERGAAPKSAAANKIDALSNRAHLGDLSPKIAKLPHVGPAITSGPASEFTQLPNLFKWNLYRLFEVYNPLPASEAKGVVGIPKALGIYDNYPFWFTFWHSLGYRVELSPSSSKELFNSALDTIPSQTVCYPAKLVHGHILALINNKPNFIFFPAMPFDLKAPYHTSGRYNCPLVASYMEIIRLNMDIIKEKNIPLLSPFLDMNDPKRLAKRLFTSLSPHCQLSLKEIKMALKAAYIELQKYRDDIHSAGERALTYIKKTGRTAVVLAGHPYHMDPEIHHGISDVIATNGLAILTCDSIDHLAPPNFNLRVVNQWIPHSRLYRAAMVTAAHDELELVQLNSFGCGLDAVTTDQVEEILTDAGKVYTLLKIDEGANLGAARIRIRSLLAAIKERRRNKTPNSTSKIYNYQPLTLDREHLNEYTLLAPQMSPVHWQFLNPAFGPAGFKLELLPTVSKAAIEEGLRYVNNDVCYPALISIGQLLHALKSGKYDLSRTAVMMAQTGGGCRATNYVGFLRKALAQAGLAEVPVWPFSLNHNEGTEGIKADRKTLKRIMMAMLYGDMLGRLLLASRPYEKTPGAAQSVFEYWSEQAKTAIVNCKRKAFKNNIFKMVEDFAALDLYPADRPKVGLVGEILINFHPEANNRAVEVVENEGGEAILPDLTDFFLYCIYDDVFQADALAGSRLKKWISLWLIRVVEKYRQPMRDSLKRFPRFGKMHTFAELKNSGENIVSLGNQFGEGWYLTADMALMLQNDIHNILCLQPFGCLPNHVTGKGVVKELKRRFPRANMVAVDYDPGTSEVNQINRIKLMMSVAHKMKNGQFSGTGLDLPMYKEEQAKK